MSTPNGSSPGSDEAPDQLNSDRLIDNLHDRVRREINRRLKTEAELDALRSAAKQIWDDLMIAHEIHNGQFKDVAEESVERLGSVLFAKQGFKP